MPIIFDSFLVAGLTSIAKGNHLDKRIYRPNGMKGFIINLTIDGSGTIITENQSFDCEKGDLLLFPPNVIHNYTRSKKSDTWEHYWIYFFPRSYWLNWLTWENTIDNIGLIKIIDKDNYNQLYTLFNETNTHFSKSTVMSEALAMNSLERIIIASVYCQNKFSDTPKDPRIKEVCDYLESNIDSNHTIEEIASQVFLSSSRLSHLFKEEMGQSMKEWRESQRITKAKMLLQTSSISITDIAVSIGYTDISYFSRMFKKHCGFSPRTYRKNYLMPSNKK
ncbi:arabinose operon transcriptional regulator AraC [Celerinatantimonas sp. MCCC 1A17872]|uniref:arabinose operon transcriptional regulator AraC n=1 Tax=Celerinatantimonas sp. MCCC 1A17872 TaxID=3177514 RepID=UPI0038CB656B